MAINLERFISNACCNSCQSFYDHYVEANVRFRSRLGMKAVIIRRQLGHCCDWCASLAGIYDPSNAPDDIYRRHSNCRCLVTYKTQDGYQDVWNKKIYQTQRDARIEKIQSFISYIDRIKNSFPNYEDVTKEYLKNSNRKKGQLTFDEGFIKKNHTDEYEYAQWFHRVFKGELVLLAEKNPRGISNPDYLWNGKLWDLKSPTTKKYNTLDGRICVGLDQIRRNYGGLMIDFTGSELTFEEAEKDVVMILNNKADRTTDAIINKGNLFKVIRMKK